MCSNQGQEVIGMALTRRGLEERLWLVVAYPSGPVSQGSVTLRFISHLLR